MTLIKVTSSGGELEYINPNFIVLICKSSRANTKISLGNGRTNYELHVSETVEQIIDRIKNAEANG